MADSTISASALTTEQLEAYLVRPLLQKSVVLAAGPRMFEGTKADPLKIPRLTTFDIGINNGASAGFWKGENVQIGEVNPSFDQVTLLPSTLDSIKLLDRYSNEIARRANQNMGELIRSSLVERVALALDYAFLRGTGGSTNYPAETTPIGLLNQAGTTAMNGASVTFDALIDMQTKAMNLSATPNQWFVSPNTFGVLRKLKDTAGRYYMQPDPTNDAIFRLVGLPVSWSIYIPDNKVILADMSQVAVARDLDITAVILTERYADFDQQGIRVTCRYDIGLLNPQAVIILTTS